MNLSFIENAYMKGAPLITKLNRTLHFVILAGLFILIVFIIFQPLHDLHRIGHQISPNTTSKDDYAKLINISFSFLHAPLTCQRGQPDFVILVHSALENTVKRNTIRNTWGHKDNGIKVLFMLGDSEDEDIRNATAEEFETHGDLVQGNFLDSYHNLTYKHVMTLKYAVYHCPDVEYIVKVDDDVFVNVPSFKKFIHLYKMDYYSSTNFLCSRMDGSPVLRSGKWGVSVEEYPGEMYPKYCSGFAVIYPRSAVHALYAQAQKTEYFWIDDVHVTGTLAAATNITYTGIEQLILSHEEVVGIVDLKFANITKPFLFGEMNVNENQINSLWNFIQHHTIKVSILDYLE